MLSSPLHKLQECVMKLRLISIIVLCLLSINSRAESNFDFNFSIKDDHFKLVIQQSFNKSFSELRKTYTPDLLHLVSNVIRSVDITPIQESISRISIRTSKHGFLSNLVSICTETNTPSLWTSVCSLDLERGDTSDFFNSGTENTICTSSTSGSTCTFTVEASVKSQRYLFIYRSSELLALGGIVEQIHDQAVLSRVINLNESPRLAKSKFAETNTASCLDQIYATFSSSAQKLEFTNKALEVQSLLWRCNP